VLDVFCKQLQYIPTRSLKGHNLARERRAKQLIEFTAEDVFANAYGLPNLGSGVRAGICDGRLHSLRQMLLRWFGIHDHEEPSTDGPDQPADLENDGDEESVDRPERLPLRTTTPPTPVTETGRSKAKKSLKQMTKAMNSEEFLAHRSPELLAADLKIAAVLLRTGLKEGWIAEADFFEATRITWSSLFFSSAGKPDQGWLERRYREADDPLDFAIRMASPELSAALAAWSMAASVRAATPEHMVHALAQVLAVARLPWLWRGGVTERIGQELGRMLYNTEGELSADELRFTEQTWVHLLRRGEALRALEEALATHSPNDVRERIQQDHVSRGELLWQGTGGYCVALQDCDRSKGDKIPVLKLQGSQKESKFAPRYLIPIKALLEPAVMPETGRFRLTEREVIHEMIDEFAGAFCS
jgi:hypothetical protein